MDLVRKLAELSTSLVLSCAGASGSETSPELAQICSAMAEGRIWVNATLQSREARVNFGLRSENLNGYYHSRSPGIRHLNKLSASPNIRKLDRFVECFRPGRLPPGGARTTLSHPFKFMPH